MPYAFTEQGVAMLSGVLKSPTAVEVNIRIMRAFVSMHHFMLDKQGENVSACIYTQQINRQLKPDELVERIKETI